MEDFKSFFTLLCEGTVESNTLLKINTTIENAGGEIYVVGGPVRDFILGHEPKDIDFLVRKLSLEEVSKALSKIGKSMEVGDQFGIVKSYIDGHEFDFAIPRTKEEKTGDEHTDFTVQVDPNASVEDDLKRRDFTWNAMAVPLMVFINIQGYPKEKAIELLKGAVIDPNNGLEDLHKGILRAVGDPKVRFGEDALRMLRAVQFATRMGYDITGETAEAIKELAPTLKNVSGERVLIELEKAWTKGKADSEVLVTLLWKLGIGDILFGSEFNPFIVSLPELKGDDKARGQFVAFFLNGGDYMGMKPDNKYVKLVEVGKLISNSKEYPFTYASNLTPQDLSILAEVFKEINPEIHQKVLKMIKTPLKGKDLSLNGQGIAQVLGITNKKDFPKIGVAQRALLSAIWDDKIQNNSKDSTEFLKTASLTEEYFKANPITGENFSFINDAGFSDEISNIVEAFIQHALTFLRLNEKPSRIRFISIREEGMTHGSFNPSIDEICVYVKGRALADFLRTLAHELVHFHQRVVGKVNPNTEYPEIGGEVEDEANAIGGQIIKSFGKKNKTIYDL